MNLVLSGTAVVALDTVADEALIGAVLIVAVLHTTGIVVVAEITGLARDLTAEVISS